MGAAPNSPLTLTGALGDNTFLPVAARVVDGLSQITEITVDAVCSDKTVDLHGLLGKEAVLTLKRETPPFRHFAGIIVRVEALGEHKGNSLYRFEIRSAMWLMTRDSDHVLYQEKTLKDILKEETADIADKIEEKISETMVKRTLCTRFFETRYDFLARLMEEEGVYWFCDPSDSTHKIVVTDNPATHQPILGNPEIPFQNMTTNVQGDFLHAFDEVGRPEELSQDLRDYDFTRPAADMDGAGKSTKKDHSAPLAPKSYRYLGHYDNVGEGNRFARIRAEAIAVGHTTWRGVTNQPFIAVGRTFSVAGHPRADAGRYLVTRAVHEVQISRDADPTSDMPGMAGRRLVSDMRDNELVRVSFDSIPADQQFRAPHVTQWPRVPGIMTAVVTGPSGEEIHTDKHGRIRIKFHHDRLSKADEKATCWVRHMTPWAGKQWGMIHIPRIGQEVVVQFEEGNPDRPIVVGMLYNADNMPPYGLDANKTQQGIKTNSSKGGGGFNELMFEDKKDAELVRFQAETNYEQIVKNNADITVGVDKADPGKMTVTIEGDLTETVNEGNHTRTIAKGDQTFEVTEGDQTEKIKGNVKWTVTDGNVTNEVSKGNVTTSVKMGNVSTTLDKGNETHTLKMGNLSTKASLGSIAEEAMQKIEMKVGGNSITIDQTGVTIKGIMVKIEGTAMLEAKAPMSTVKGDALLILKGGLTMIN